jgi:predicted acetyltransferase
MAAEKPDIRLELPDAKYKESFLAAVREFMAQPERNESEKHYENYTPENFDEMVAKRLSEITEVPDGMVTQSCFWIIDSDGYAGRIALRHRLNENLAQRGGHIGYDVRPGRRRRGYVKAALRLCLAEAAKMGLPEIFITCKDWNEASHRTILGALNEYGGREVDPLETEERRFLRFWINTAKEK